jgi:O-methyltransferase
MMPESVWESLDKFYPSECHKLERFALEYQPIRHLPGHFAEFGVYNGGGSRELARLDATRMVWAFDTYAGMPSEDYHAGEDDANPPGKWTPAAPPADLFRGIPNIMPVGGRFADTLPSLLFRPLKLLLVHIDCDYYESYRQVLEFLERHMTPGGVAFIDDYEPGHNCHGCVRAVDEWLAKVGSSVRREGDRIYFRGE